VLADAEAQSATAKEEAQAKLDAVAPTRLAVIAAATDARTAAEKARKFAHHLEPVSIFISRKTQHLYVRQNFQEVAFQSRSAIPSVRLARTSSPPRTLAAAVATSNGP
jgi:hypothetical protein